MKKQADRTMRVLSCAAAMLLTLGPAVAAQHAADTSYASLVAAERAYAEHSLRRSAQSALTTYLAQNALLYRPRVVRAAAYLRARPMVDYLALTWEPVFGDISAAGDFGYTTGPWISSDRRQPEVNPTFGQYARLWRRQPDGSWRVEIEAGVPHEADSIGPGRTVRAAASQWRRSAAESGAARASLLRADSAFARDAETEGAASAFRRRADPQLRLLRHGRFPLLGTAATSFLRAADGYTWRPVAANVAASGDLGYTYGVYAVTTGAGAARTATESGDYLRIWRRTAAGEWRVVLDLTSKAR
jgi:ketosteroid isomerase-like protein